MQIAITILLLIIMMLLLVIIVGFFFFLFDIFLELPYVATKRNKIDTIVKFAAIKEGETIVDLGSGDGRLLIASAQKGAKAIGYEINPFLIGITRIRAWLSLRGAKRRSNLDSGQARMTKGDRHGHQDDLAMTGKVIVYKSDLWRADLAIADVVFVYGRRKTMQKFEDFVYKNSKKGTRIIVNTNLTVPFPTQKPQKQKDGIFLYVV